MLLYGAVCLDTVNFVQSYCRLAQKYGSCCERMWEVHQCFGIYELYHGKTYLNLL